MKLIEELTENAAYALERLRDAMVNVYPVGAIVRAKLHGREVWIEAEVVGHADKRFQHEIRVKNLRTGKFRHLVARPGGGHSVELVSLPANVTEQQPAAPALLPAAGLLCGCGRPVQYSHGDKHSCNKRVVCPTYDELREQCCRANALALAYREKRRWDGLNGRTWSASKHFDAEARIEELESHNRKAERPPMKTPDSQQTLKAVRSGAWLGRFCVCARWDWRRAVVVAQTKADAHAIATAAVAAAVGIVMLPWCIVRAILRWPCKPLYWGWVAWRNTAGFDRIEQLVAKRPNDKIHP